MNKTSAKQKDEIAILNLLNDHVTALIDLAEKIEKQGLPHKQKKEGVRLHAYIRIVYFSI